MAEKQKNMDIGEREMGELTLQYENLLNDERQKIQFHDFLDSWKRYVKVSRRVAIRLEPEGGHRLTTHPFPMNER